MYGIPYPGVFVSDGDGRVVSKFFHDSYKKRDSPEILLDAALGRVQIDESAPCANAGDDAVRVTAQVRGGRGTIRQGILRHLVVRFAVREGLHIYGEPVLEGMVPTRVRLSGPPGLVVEEPILPPTARVHLQSMGTELSVWSGIVDIVVPFYAVGELASEVRPLDRDSVQLEIDIAYQACSDDTCLLPRTEKLTLDVPLEVVDVPSLALHRGHGQREGGYDATPHMLRLLLRKVRAHPLGLVRYVWKNGKLELAARRRARAARKPASGS